MPVLAMSDVEPEILSVNIFITQGAYLADAEAGGIHQSGHGLLLQIRHSGNESPGILSGGDIGKIFIEPAEGELGIVPCFVEDIDGKKAEL